MLQNINLEGNVSDIIYWCQLNNMEFFWAGGFSYMALFENKKSVVESNQSSFHMGQFSEFCHILAMIM